MNEPVWLGERLVLRLHATSLERYGGGKGLRDAGLLSSALQRAPNRWAYEGVQDVPALAATYAVAISANHPFVDGNKRAAFASLGMFLLLNGFDLRAASADATRVVLGVAAGEVELDALAEWVRRNVVAS